MRLCRKCHQEKPTDEFEITNTEHGWRRKECRACVKLRVQRRYVDSKRNILEWQKGEGREKHNTNCLSSYYRSQHEAIMAYGGYKCNCCGETNPLFLSIDHVNNDGTEHRQSFQSHGTGLYRWLKHHGYPEGFQILCMNCNFGKRRNHGVCPHKGFSENVNFLRFKEQRLSRQGVGSSEPKHLMTRTVSDIV